MSQASSLQREPSMEEILASIRRIIEDSDGGRKPAEAAAPQPAPAPKAEVESFRAELGSAATPLVERRQPAAAPAQLQGAHPEPAQAAEPARPFRLAEVQAHIAREAARPAEPERKPVMLADIQQQIARDANTRPAAFTPEQPSAEVKLQPAAQIRPAPDAKPQAIAQIRPAPEPAFEKPGPEVRGETPPSSLPASWLREDAPAKPAVPAAAPSAQAADAGTARQAIISPVAGRQVAAAFSELSEAFAARSKKSLEEMAEQILRPMLQEWLDNNLPLLVERLVREEIERVARGS
jgi:cell pole-organizing protein PopZ